ncbi:MAG: MMPL family transporter [Candidatus Thiodiazotropha sp. (ex. Lucinoma kazani)]
MQNPTTKQTLAWLIFQAVTAWPKTLIVLGLLLIISCASFIPGPVKDTRSDAFLPDDESALIYRDKVKAIFGLTDPMVVAVVNEGRSEANLLANDKDLIAQYFLLYSVSSDPNDFEAVVDYDYRLANVHVSMDSGKYSDEKLVVEAVQAYLDSHFNTTTISANLSGRVNVDYHWIKRLGDTNWGSVSFALLLVWLMATLAFRSVVAGIITITPVTLTVLVVYAVMSFSGIWLSISTSMFAAIAIGLGVDFSVHTIERLQVLLRDEQRSLDESITLLFASTGRALLFNFVALSLGFFVLVTSKVVVLQEFGAIVALAVMLGFLTSLMLFPALVKEFRPKFLGFDRRDQSVSVQVVPRIESAQR